MSEYGKEACRWQASFTHTKFAVRSVRRTQLFGKWMKSFEVKFSLTGKNRRESPNFSDAILECGLYYFIMGLNRRAGYVLHFLYMSHGDPVVSL